LASQGIRAFQLPEGYSYINAIIQACFKALPIAVRPCFAEDKTYLAFIFARVGIIWQNEILKYECIRVSYFSIYTKNLTTIRVKYIMNIKRIFGALLTILGIVGLIYAAILFINNTDGTRGIKALVVYGILGLIFFIAGVSLIRTIKDES
jgi:hypothetical protein